MPTLPLPPTSRSDGQYQTSTTSREPPKGQKERTFTATARREQIIAAAIETIAEVGYGQASLARIGQRVGISKGVLIYHFGSEEDLVKEVIREVLAKASEYMVPRIAAASGGRQKLRAYIDSNIGFMGEHPSYLIAIVEIARGARGVPGGQASEGSWLESGTAALAELLAGFQASGEFRSDFDPRVMAETFQAAIDAATVAAPKARRQAR